MTFPDYHEIYGVTEQQIRDAAAHPQAGATALQSVADEMANDHQAITANSSGGITAPTTENVAASQQNLTKLSGNGAYVAGIINFFADKVHVFDTTVSSINAKWTGRVQALRRVETAPDGIPMTYAEASSAATSAFVAEYNTAVQQLDQDADDVERMLTEGATDANVRTLVHEGLMTFSAAERLGVNLTNEDKAAYFASRMETMTPEQRVDYLMSTHVDPAVMTIILNNDSATAQAAVTRAKGLSEGLINGTWHDGDLQTLNNMLAKFGHSVAFATPLMNQLGPEKLMQLNLRIAQFTSDDAPGAYYNEDGGPADDEIAALIKTFQENMSVTLATATGGPDGYPTDTPPEYRLRSDFMTDLYEAGKSKIQLNGPYDNSQLEVYGYQLLAPLLTTGKFDTDFLSQVGWGMSAFDRYGGENGGSPWINAYVNSGNSVHGLRLDWTQGTGSQHPAGWDPLIGLMNGFANNPEASHQFFTSQRTYTSEGEYNDTLRYLLNERVWGLGGVDTPWQAIGADEKGYFDKKLYEQQNDRNYMDAFGNALAAATSLGDQKSATLFGDVVNEVGTGGHWGKDDRFEDIRDSFAEMGAQHIGAINTSLANRAAGEGGDISGILPGMQYDPGLSKNDPELWRFLNSIGFDADAKTYMAAAESVYMQAGYDHFISDSTIPLDERIKNLESQINTPMGSVFGAMDYGEASNVRAEYKQADQEHNDQVDAKYKVIGFFVDQIPFSKLPAGGDLASMGVDGWLEMLQKSEHVDTSAVAQTMIGNSYFDASSNVTSVAEVTLYAHLTDAEKVALFGDDIPMSEDGTPKPMSEWTEQDVQQFESALNDPGSYGGTITKHGTEAGSSYMQGYNAAETALG